MKTCVAKNSKEYPGFSKEIYEIEKKARIHYPFMGFIDPDDHDVDVNEIFKKSCIWGTKQLSTNVDSSTDTTLGWTKNTQKPKLFEKRKKIIQNAKTQKCIEICQNWRYALRPKVSNPSGIVVSGWTKNTQKSIFFEKQKKSSKLQKLKNI